MELEINEWIDLLNTSEKPGPEIIAFNFGLFEKTDGFGVYLIGSRGFDENDDDWACDVDFEPKRKYLDISNSHTEGKKWSEVLTDVTRILKRFIDSEKFTISIFKNARAITTGFDDGDLNRIM